jgi:hypothetical protein
MTVTRGCVRAWGEEDRRAASGALRTRHDRALFRRGFRTALRQTAGDTGTVIRDLEWGRAVELLDWPSGAPWTRIRAGADEGFARTEHLVEIAHVDKTTGVNAYTAQLELDGGEKVALLWGDYVQVIERAGATCKVRARGLTGTIPSNRLTGDALLEIYFVDVGQGDGVLVRTPDGRHMIIDGGLPRSNQLTGKNAADFVDWKFFFDYGDPVIRLDALVASHSDADHYGGLWDLVRLDDAADDRELDVLSVGVDAFYHPGLSRWETRTGGAHPHRDDLGPNDGAWFLRLLDDRADAEAAIVNGAADELGGDWRDFIKDLLRRIRPQVVRLGVERETLQSGGALPRMWTGAGGCDVSVLAPVTVRRDGKPALKDLGDTAQNTNGHSVCLRLDYGHARIVLTGDLNSASMGWLMESYGDRVSAFACDAVNACHHGSSDISYRFLEQLKAGATIVSSGDNEGYAHPRPEIVAASAMTGHLEIDRAKDRPDAARLMTEIERSVAVGEITHPVCQLSRAAPTDGSVARYSRSRSPRSPTSRFLTATTRARSARPLNAAAAQAIRTQARHAGEDALDARGVAGGRGNPRGVSLPRSARPVQHALRQQERVAVPCDDEDALRPGQRPDRRPQDRLRDHARGRRRLDRPRVHRTVLDPPPLLSGTRPGGLRPGTRPAPGRAWRSR